MGVAIMLGLAFLALAIIPQMWVSRVISVHSAPRADFPGSGGQFARYLLDEMKLFHVHVEETNLGDHYDPESKTVRLVKNNMHGHSLAAVVIAAHEVGHAMQDATDYQPLRARTKMARRAQSVQMIGSIVMLAAPLMMIVTKSPGLMLMQIAAGLAMIGSTLVMHALTLPVEFDASFKRALPVLEAGEFFDRTDMRGARSILWAAALTYVAGAAMSLLNIAQWIRVLR